MPCVIVIKNNVMPDQVSTRDITDVLKRYINTNIELTKLELIERGSVMGSVLVSGFFLAMISLIFVMLLSIGLSYLIGEMLGSTFQGFAIVSGFYLLLGVVLLMVRKSSVEKTVRDKMISELIEQV